MTAKSFAAWMWIVLIQTILNTVVGKLVMQRVARLFAQIARLL